ncbi:CPBP family intramembrane glutamic endopeptidase [Prescottella equi]|uniref:CPBP family intramembrane glutamic endopeptidase n=1 Tax=Rhodococcus hoagii TaxID=43767 RepID=UPI0015849693|nr:CPBP family intramembrane glutamic endopeptidase [Prescottella equi]
MDVSDQTKAEVAEYEAPALFAVKALAAGLAEEPLLAALPVLLLCGRLPIAAIVALGGALRGLLHVYYGGYGFVWAFIWGGAAVWIYYRYRRLWLLVLLHGFVNNLQAIALVDTVPDWLAAAALLVSSLGAFVLALIWLGRNWSHLRLRVTAAKRYVRTRVVSTGADDGHEKSVDPRPGGGQGSASLRKGDRTQTDSVSRTSATHSD